MIRFVVVVSALSVLLVFGIAAPAAAQDRSQQPGVTSKTQPLVILTSQSSCANGVCTLGPGNVGTSFAEAVTSTGGKGPTPYTWSVVAGSLPAGLSLTPSYGVYSAYVHGTPTTPQASTFTLQVRDGIGDTARQAYSLTIDPTPSLLITFPASCCPNGTVGTTYLQNFFVSGGVGPYNASIDSGQLPPGLRLSTAPPISITGVPTTAGTFTFTLRVTDSIGGQATKQGSIVVR